MTRQFPASTGSWPAVGLWTLVALLMGGLGLAFLNHQRALVRQNIQDELSAIADLKVRQIVQWREERFQSARMIAADPLLARAVQEFLAHPDTGDLRGPLSTRLQSIQFRNQSVRALLLDRQLNVRLAAPAGDEYLGPIAQTFAAQALESNLVVVSDLHRSHGTGYIHFDIAIPIHASSSLTGTEMAPGRSPVLGVIDLEVDPSRSLYELIQGWPASSRTAETLLVRREGDQAVFLNELRHKKNTALAFRVPLRGTNLVAPRAVLGQESILEGLDYRHLPVLAAVRAVPGTAWVLLAKIDQQEAFAPLRTPARLTLATIFALILCAGLAFWALRRQLEARLLQDELSERRRVEKQLIESETRFRSLFENMVEGVAHCRMLFEGGKPCNFIYLDVNKPFEKLTGLKDVVGRKVSDVIPGIQKSDGGLLEIYGRVASTGRPERVEIYVEALKHWFDITVYSPTKDHFVAVFDVITERKRTEARIDHLNQLLRAIRDINKLIVREREPGQLLREACHILVQTRGYLLVWVGTPELDSKRVVPAASAGPGADYLDHITVTWDDQPTGRGPVGTALRTRNPWVSQDLANDPRFAPWREQARQRGYASMASIPMVQLDRVFGALNVYGDDPGAFDAEELSLLDEVAGDLAFALRSIEQESERTKAEEALHASQQILEGVLNAMPVRVFWKDKNLVYLGCNAAFARDAGFAAPQDLIGKDDREMSWRDQAELYRAGDRQVIETGCAKSLVEEPQTTPDGKSITLLTTKVPLRSATGEICGVLGTYIDITERKQAEEGRRRLAAAVEQASESIVITDVTGAILYVNPAFEKVTGYNREEALGKNPRVFKSGKHGPEFYRQMWETLARGEAWHGRMINQRKNGTLFEEDANISPIRDASGKTINYVAVKRDVSHEVLLEAQLRQAQKMEAVGQLAGGVAHDFNNILAATLMHLELLQMEPSLNQQTQESLKELVEEVQKGARLTRQLLVFSRRQVPQVKPLDLNRVLAELMKMLKRLLGEHIQIDFHGGGAPLWIEADTGMMEQVITNLTVNARDAMPNSGQLTIAATPVEITPETAQSNAQARAGSFVCLSVADTGCGMDAATLERIFEPFFTTKEVGKGTGLGLATVHGIVKQHQGWVEVESEVNRGTTFRVYLPALAQAPQPEICPQTREIRGGHETMLLVEDDPSVRNSVALTLQRYGYRVLQAANSREALAQWEGRQGGIDLLLTDMVMPEGMTGFELAEHLRKASPGLKVVLSSGYSRETAALTEERLQGMIYLPKPYDAATLAATVRKCMDQAPAQCAQTSKHHL